MKKIKINVVANVVHMKEYVCIMRERKHGMIVTTARSHFQRNLADARRAGRAMAEAFDMYYITTKLRSEYELTDLVDKRVFNGSE